MSSAKFMVLQKIRAERDVLFAEGCIGAAKARKMQVWGEVAELARSVGIMQDKPWQYMRDTIWPNWRKRTLAKSLSGNSSNNNEMDELVLEILEKPESSGNDPVESEQTHNIDNIFDGTIFTDAIYASPIERETRKRKRQVPISVAASSRKHERIDLQIEMLKIKKYKVALEALELERRLGLPRSKFTEGLPLPAHPDRPVRPSDSSDPPSGRSTTNNTDNESYKVER